MTTPDPEPSAIVGLELWGVHLAAATLTVQLGVARAAPTKRDPVRQVGQYALHVQCPYQVSCAGTPDDLQGLVARWGQLRVEDVIEGPGGRLVLRLSRDCELTVLANASSDDEQWRLFSPGTSSRHLVFAGGKRSFE